MVQKKLKICSDVNFLSIFGHRKTLDPDWIRIGIHPKMLDPDPYQMNSDPKRYVLFFLKNLQVSVKILVYFCAMCNNVHDTV